MVVRSGSGLMVQRYEGCWLEVFGLMLGWMRSFIFKSITSRP